MEPKKRVRNAYQHSKTDVRYWRERVFKPVYSRGGTAVEAQNWAVEIQHGGQRRRWSLEPRIVISQRHALRRDTYSSRSTVGSWPRRSGRPEPVRPHKFDTTIGEFLAELRAKADAKPKTLQAYARAFRTLVAYIAGLPSGGRGGSAETHRLWREKVDAVKLATITPAKVQEWKRRFIARAGETAGSSGLIQFMSPPGKGPICA